MRMFSSLILVLSLLISAGNRFIVISSSVPITELNGDDEANLPNSVVPTTANLLGPVPGNGNGNEAAGLQNNLQTEDDGELDEDATVAESELEESEEEYDGESDIEDDGEGGEGDDDLRYEMNNLGNATLVHEANTFASNFIAGLDMRFNPDIISFISHDWLERMMSHTRGSEIIARNVRLLFCRDIESIKIDSIHPNFFKFFDFLDLNFFLNERENAKVPNAYILKAVHSQTIKGTLNLKVFVKILELLDPSILVELDEKLLLPHLYEIDRMRNPEFYLAKTLAFNSRKDLSSSKMTIWNISAQLTLLVLSQTGMKFTANLVNPTVAAAQKSLIDAFEGSANRGQDINGFNLNYFKNGRILQPNLSSAFVNFEAFTAKLGIPNFISLDYSKFNTGGKIIYRLILYVGILNPELITSDLFYQKFATVFCEPNFRQDLTTAENVFISNIIIPILPASGAKAILNTSFHSSFSQLILISLNNDPKIFAQIVESCTTVEERLYWLKKSEARFNVRLNMKDETFYKTAQESNPALLQITSSASANSDEIVQNHTFASHFLNSGQLQDLFIVSEDNAPRTRPSLKKVAIPVIDQEFFEEYFDFTMQHLDREDFGESDWSQALQKKSTEAQAAYTKKMAALDRFVRIAFQALYFSFRSPNTFVEFRYEGSQSFGEGPRLEAFNFLARALLLPRYKVFFYNHGLAGFVPYPLLHPEIMSALGYLSAWFIDKELHVSFSLAEAYTKFLFYEENPTVSMQDLVNVLYGPLFKLMDKFVDPSLNPLDYLPIFYKTHQPLAFTRKFNPQPFDLFSPSDISRNPITPVVSWIDSNLIDVLDEVIVLPEENFDPKMKSEDNKNFQELSEKRAAYSQALARHKVQMEAKMKVVEMLKDAVTDKIIDYALKGRFSFIRNFLKAFNSHAQPFVNSHFYKKINKLADREFTYEEMKAGLKFGPSCQRIEVSLSSEPNIKLTAEETLLKILSTFSPEELKKFYHFCTGTPILPLRGLHTNPINVIADQKALFFTSHTCFRNFLFHVQKTYEANYGGVRLCILNPIVHDMNDEENQVQARAEDLELMTRAFVDVAEMTKNENIESNKMEVVETELATSSS